MLDLFALVVQSFQVSGHVFLESAVPIAITAASIAVTGVGTSIIRRVSLTVSSHVALWHFLSEKP